jgi:hypothetical protein
VVVIHYYINICFGFSDINLQGVFLLCYMLENPWLGGAAILAARPPSPQILDPLYVGAALPGSAIKGRSRSLLSQHITRA